MLLGAAGVLEGKRATSHWAVRDYLRNFGAEPVAERVVIEGKVITAAGVSAGIDMALTLAGRIAGDDEARALQLIIEYDPQPPYDSGSLEKADPETQQRATEVLKQGVEQPVAG
jgi:transcriptional regulator GlxA family with amidase domain